MKCRLMRHNIWIFTVSQCIHSGGFPVYKGLTTLGMLRHAKGSLGQIFFFIKLTQRSREFFLSEGYPLTRFLSIMLTSDVHLIQLTNEGTTKSHLCQAYILFDMFKIVY